MDELTEPRAVDHVTFQPRVERWMAATFGHAISQNRLERCFRFFEEATELVQAGGMSIEDAHRLVDYVYGRPIGEVHQEVGGTMVTLAAFCSAYTISMSAAAEMELTRCWLMKEKIRQKQAAKAIRDQGLHSPLPGEIEAEADDQMPEEYTLERALTVARLWRAGKLIGADEDAVRNALLAELERRGATP